MKKLVTFVLSGFLAFSMCACSTGSDASDNSNSTEQATEQETEKKKESDTQSFSIGEEITIGDWKITVNGIQFLDTIEDDFMVFSPDEGGKFAVISASVTNNGKNASKFLPTVPLDGDISTKLLYSDGYEFISTSLLAASDLHDEVLNPLMSAEGNIVFDMPEAAASDDKELTIKFFQGDAAANTSVSVKLR